MSAGTPDRHLGYLLATGSGLGTDLAAMGQARWAADPLAVAATCYQLQTMGESTKHLTAALKERHPEVPWRQVVGLRNHLAHEHLDIDVAIIYDVATRSAPRLAAVAAAELGRLERRRGGPDIGPGRDFPDHGRQL